MHQQDARPCAVMVGMQTLTATVATMSAETVDLKKASTTNRRPYVANTLIHASKIPFRAQRFYKGERRNVTYLESPGGRNVEDMGGTNWANWELYCACTDAGYTRELLV